MAQTIDPHAVYERQCGGCHSPHAGEFARENLVRRGDSIVGRKSGKEVGRFLADGHGGLVAQEAKAVAAHLASIVKNDGVFNDRCKICHGRAADFARLTLEIEKGRVTGLYSGRDIEAFLLNHGRLTDPDRATIMRMLRGQLASYRRSWK